MPSVGRLGDYCSGHECYPPRQNNQGSPNVFVNSLGWHRKGDHWPIHRCGKYHHEANLAEGSSSVFVNSTPAGRIGDPLDCGSALITGSFNVFCGG